MRQEELDAFNSNNIMRVGKYYDSVTRNYFANTHRYIEDVKYLHFFKSKEDIRFVQQMYKNYDTDYYICEFNIPALTAIRYRGKGTYDEGGYDCDRINVTEFAIPVSEIKAEYMVSRDLDQKHHAYIQSRKGDFKCNN